MGQKRKTGRKARVCLLSGGGGVLYAVQEGGALLWYRDALRDGTNDPNGAAGWDIRSGRPIGAGWADFTTLLSGGDGVIYAVRPDGELLFFQDLLRDGSNATDGSTGWQANSGRQIGTGWDGFGHIVSGGEGVIYVVTAKGELLWYRDVLRNGTNGPTAAVGWAPASGARVGSGWDVFTHLFHGEPGVIFACRSAELGGVIHRYRDLLRDGGNGVGGAQWETAAATSGSGWQVAAVEGYCWPMSGVEGDTLSFHVSSSCPGDATVSYVSLGGRGPRLGVPVQAGAAFQASFQGTGGYAADCGWPASFTLSVPRVEGAWQPGFYAARVKGLSGPAYDIPFVVRRGKTAAPLALLVNVNTWNAYNTWGGASNYTGMASPIELTHKRPNHHLLTYPWDHGNGTHMLRGEIWLHGWLKSQGYAVDLLTDIDLEADTDALQGYKALILNTHPEYWTQTMMGRVAEYLNQGGSVLYLGGNAMYRPTSLSGTDGGRSGLMTTEAVQWASYPEYEGKPLLAARVEDLGGPGPGAGLRITDPEHRFMPGGVVAGQVIGTTGWNGIGATRWGASGWETDYWPAPLPADVVELARDTASAKGSAIACYSTAAGGFVLGVGSLTFVGAMVEDPILAQIIANALNEALTKV